jgi:hypothetical protein
MAFAASPLSWSRRPIPMLRIGAPRLEPASTQVKSLTTRKRKKTLAPFRGPAYFFGSGGSQPTLSSTGYSDGYSLERATLEDGQSADVRALTTLGAGRCIACQRS